MSGFSVVVLAGGSGRRMRSQLHKALHPLSGKPMILYGIDAAIDAGAGRLTVVVGDEGDAVVDCVRGHGLKGRCDFVRQSIARGSADAALVGCEAMSGELALDDNVVVMPTDTPLVTADTLSRLVTHNRATEAAATVLTGVVDDPDRYCRIARSERDDTVVRVVDRLDPDLSSEPKADNAPFEVASGVYCFREDLVSPALRRVRPDNPQGELLLGDVIEVLTSTGHQVESLAVDDQLMVAAVKDRAQLAEVDAELRRRINETWLTSGVTMIDPRRTYIDATVTLGVDVTLYPGVVLGGSTSIADGARIGPDTHLVDTIVEEAALVQNSVAVDAFIGASATVGPFAVVPAGHRISKGTSTGPFYSPPP